MTHRLSILLVVGLCVMAFAPSDGAAQGRDGRGSGAPPMRALTPFEEFIDKLRLDAKTQLPQVQTLMNDAAAASAPMVTEMLQLRQQVANLEMANKAGEKAPVLTAYAAVAARMVKTEATTFAGILAILKPNQQSKADEAFARMAGIFIPAASAGRAGRGAVGAVNGRLEILNTLFTLKSDQKRDIKTWFDAAHKELAETRKGLAATRASLLAAIQAGSPQADVDAAANAYAVHVTTMTDAEMTLLARLVQRLDPEQRADQAAITTTFGLMRGFFVNNSKWDIAPDGRAY